MGWSNIHQCLEKTIEITNNKSLLQQFKIVDTQMKESLTRTIKSISRIPTITLTNKRTFGVSTAGIDMTWAGRTFINV
jgi:hypothetical protein